MNTNLAQLYLQLSEPSINSNSQIWMEISEIYENPESILEIISILTSDDVNDITRHSASVGLKMVIKKNLEFLIEDLQSNGEQSALNNILIMLHEERDSYVSLQIITALNPVFRQLGDSWEQLNNLLSELFDSSAPIHINTGLRLMSDFLPFAGSDFVSQHLETLGNFIQSSLNSDDNDIQIHGIELFSSLLQTEVPVDEFADSFYEIFKRSLEIFHNFQIINDVQKATDASREISSILKIDQLFAPSSDIYNLLLEILSDGSISSELYHLPLFPIGKLLKHYGEELQEYFSQSIEYFLTISTTQFNDASYSELQNSTLIIPLFSYMVDAVDNPDELINGILQAIWDNENIDESFAALCALMGIVESSCNQVGNYCQRMIEYGFERAKLENLAVTQAVIKLLYELVDNQSESILEFVGEISNFAFQIYQLDIDEETNKSSIDTIRLIFFNLDLDISFVLNFLPNLIQSYQEAHIYLKPSIMQCLSSCIESCREDSELFADDLLPIVYQGSQSTSESEMDDKAFCIEALGYFLSFIPKKCEEIYEESITIILAATSDENFLLRSIGINSLINIIKFSQGDLPYDFTQYVIEVAVNALNMKLPENDGMYAEDDSSITVEDIIVSGFKLLRFLIKYHYNSCIVISAGLPRLIDSALLKTPPIQVIAIKTAAYYIIVFNPDQTDIYDSLFNLITNKSDLGEVADESVVIACFNTYRKILMRSNNQLAGLYFERYMEAALACLAHQLPFQNESFEYIKEVTKMLVTFFETAIYEQPNAFPAEKFLQVVSEVIKNVEEKEAFKILSLIATFVNQGGEITEDIAVFGLEKLQLCDFVHGPEPIIFVRSIINKQPQVIESQVELIAQFFIQRLSEDISPLKHYWQTITNIISTLFTLIFSESLDCQTAKSDECFQLILSKLPVKGDYVEADFIYKSISQLIKLRSRSKDIEQFIPEIARVFIQTLAFSQKKFEKFDFSDDAIENMVSSVVSIFEFYPQVKDHVNEFLSNDKVNIDHFANRMENFLNNNNLK